MNHEELLARLGELKDKISNIENLLKDPYNSEEIEFQLQELDDELESFRFYLEERLY